MQDYSQNFMIVFLLQVNGVLTLTDIFAKSYKYLCFYLVLEAG